MMNENIKLIVADLLFEEKTDKDKDSMWTKPDKPSDSKNKEKSPRAKKPGIEASTGSGRFSKGVNEAGALASEDPGQLMKNLSIKTSSGVSDLDKVESVLSQAFQGAEPMKKVYSSLTRVSNGEKNGLSIKVSVIKIRESVKYLYHTLVGARNAKILKIDSLIQIENYGGGVIIYQGSKNSWGK